MADFSEWKTNPMKEIGLRSIVAIAGLIASTVAVIALVPPLLTPYSDEPRAVPTDTLVSDSQLAPIEARAQKGDVDAIRDLMGFYSSSSRPDREKFDIIDGNTEDSKKARYWLEMAIQKGDQDAIYGSALGHAERAMVNELNPKRRRKYGYKAIDLYLLLHNGEYRDAMTPRIREMLISLRQMDELDNK